MGRWGGIERKVTFPGEKTVPKTALRAAKGRPKRPPRRVAVLITHGMGQQLPFETLDAMAEGLIRTAKKLSGKDIDEIRAVTRRLGDLTTQRIEFNTQDKEGNDVIVHVYEGYWAPLTEGQVGLTDVMWFLVHAAGSGMRIAFGRFKRWMFGKEVDFGKVAGALPSLLFATAILLSLVLLNAVIAAFSAYRIFNGDLGNLCSSGVVEPGCKYYALTFMTGCFGFVTIVTAAVLYCLSKLNRFGETPGIRFIIRMPLLGFFCVLIIAWSLMALFWWLPLFSGPAEILDQYDIVSTVGKRLWLPIWGLLAFGSWVVKLFMVEYVGDVAAYISSHSLDKFNDLRIRIKATVFAIAKAIYAQKDQPYDGVILAGHSLGSVITYDTLNALINDDALNGAPLNVMRRTRLLLTFGSPLDKTAYIFANQWTNTTATREALAASLQPLILEYDLFRDIDWVNVCSIFDIVSNWLKFYDYREALGYNNRRRVQNEWDWKAITPLLAHIEYWRNELIFKHIYEHL